MFTKIIVVVTGSSTKIDIKMPIKEQAAAATAAKIITDLYVLNILIAESAGKMIIAAVSKEPSKFMDIAMTTPVITDNINS